MRDETDDTRAIRSILVFSFSFFSFFFSTSSCRDFLLLHFVEGIRNEEVKRRRKECKECWKRFRKEEILRLEKLSTGILSFLFLSLSLRFSLPLFSSSLDLWSLFPSFSFPHFLSFLFFKLMNLDEVRIEIVLKFFQSRKFRVIFIPFSFLTSSTFCFPFSSRFIQCFLFSLSLSLCHGRINFRSNPQFTVTVSVNDDQVKEKEQDRRKEQEREGRERERRGGESTGEVRKNEKGEMEEK